MVLSAAVVYLFIAWLPAQTAEPAQSAGQSETFDLAKLRVADDRALPVEARTATLLDYLQEELKHPSKPKMGYGGIIDTEWIQRQMVRVLGRVGDPALIADEMKRTQDSALKDRLTIALCLASKGKSAAPETLQILKSSKEGHVRALAALALGQVQYKPAIPALMAALRDGYKRPITGGTQDTGRYEVREDAATALRKLGFKVKTTDTAAGPVFEVVK